jgi:hypothetical protein
MHFAFRDLAQVGKFLTNPGAFGSGDGGEACSAILCTLLGKEWDNAMTFNDDGEVVHTPENVQQRLKREPANAVIDSRVRVVIIQREVLRRLDMYQARPAAELRALIGMLNGGKNNVTALCASDQTIARVEDVRELVAGLDASKVSVFGIPYARLGEHVTLSPELLAPLKSLTSLDVSGTPGLIGEAIASLAPTLRALYIANCGLGQRGGIPAWVFTLRRLEHLDVSDNELAAAHFRGIGALADTLLSLTARGLITDAMAAARALPPPAWMVSASASASSSASAKTASSSQLPPRMSAPPWIGKLDRLRSLDASRGSFRQLPPMWGRLKRLQVLNLWGCVVLGRPIETGSPGANNNNQGDPRYGDNDSSTTTVNGWMLGASCKLTGREKRLPRCLGGLYSLCEINVNKSALVDRWPKDAVGSTVAVHVAKRFVRGSDVYSTSVYRRNNPEHGGGGGLLFGFFGGEGRGPQAAEAESRTASSSSSDEGSDIVHRRGGGSRQGLGWHSRWADAIGVSAACGKGVWKAVRDIKKRKIVAKRRAAPLPQDVLRRIVLRLAPETAATFRAVCRSWKQACDAEYSFVDLAVWARFRLLVYTGLNGDDGECPGCIDSLPMNMISEEWMRKAQRDLIDQAKHTQRGDCEETDKFIRDGLNMLKQWFAVPVCGDECAQRPTIAQLTDAELVQTVGYAAGQPGGALPYTVSDGFYPAMSAFNPRQCKGPDHNPAWLLADRIQNLNRWLEQKDSIVAAAVRVGVERSKIEAVLQTMAVKLELSKSGHKLARVSLDFRHWGIANYSQTAAMCLNMENMDLDGDDEEEAEGDEEY